MPLGSSKELSRDELDQVIKDLHSQDLSLDMTRGKPSPAQLDLSNAILTILDEKDFIAEDGTDCRNYGGLDGLPEVKKLFADYLGVSPKEIIIGGNASLPLMDNAMTLAMLFGTRDSYRPWIKEEKIKFLCPVPGYDRHFGICEHLNIEMINIPIGEDGQGPDMDLIESLVLGDDLIKGIWCVPKYSNPTGDTYNTKTVKRLASMPTKAKDFRIFWDNAYHVHRLADKTAQLDNILEACKDEGNANRVYIFGSTSKITYASAGIGLLAASEANIAYFKKHISAQTIGPDKINQLRHLRFFKSVEGIYEHMDKHASLLKTKI